MIEKLPRAPMRREDEPEYEKEIWQPSWRCFCCHDTGIINERLAAMVIEEYDSKHDKLPRCVSPGCDAGSQWDSEALIDCVDYRINAATCQKLDAIERENWRQTARQQQINLKALAQKMNLRMRDRSLLEETEAQRRHEEALNAEPAELREMAHAYLGSDYMRDGPT